MPKGKYVNHKGRNRHFSSPEELEEQRRQEEEQRKWRSNKDDSSGEEGNTRSSKNKDKNSESQSESDSESESESEHEGKAKGVENLIQVQNPNRVQKKTKKLSQINETLAESSKTELSRKEKEQLKKQRAYAHYRKLHAAGKTEEAQADLARLAIIKKQREEAAKKREEEKKQKELAQQKKSDQMKKALGKKS